MEDNVPGRKKNKNKAEEFLIILIIISING